MNFKDIKWFMSLALSEAEKAEKAGEVPVGAVIVSPEGEVIAKASNLKEQTHNPIGHAEIIAITQACSKLGSWRLVDCTLYVTLEPCPMCLSAIAQARIKNLYFGAYDKKGGAISLGYNMAQDSKLNHFVNIFGGMQHFECSKILSEFFKRRRLAYRK